MSTAAPALVWLRDDLRLADNPALRAAVDSGRPVVVAVVLDEQSDECRPLGGASRWWLHHSLDALGRELGERGAGLTLRRGAAEEEIPALVADTRAEAVFWNRRYGRTKDLDARLKSRLRGDGVEVQSFAANVLVEPWELSTGSGAPFQVFTPFWNALRRHPIRDTVAEPRTIEGRRADGDALADWRLLPSRPDWAGGLRDTWVPGERGAHDRLTAFVRDHLADYGRRDEPAVHGTSMLSPHLRFGEVSPVQLWHRLHESVPADARKRVDPFLREVGWRDFNHSILFHFPQLDSRDFRDGWSAFPWRQGDEPELERWRFGRTGIPLVDAGMRQLWTTGWMHNRVRLVAASFLVKNLLIDWRVGERWFWDTLVDADEANNPGNWQWVAGTGADAAPYFRVFNPELQREKFDRQDEYVRAWVPEYGTDDYPEPMVDLAESRREALDAYRSMRT